VLHVSTHTESSSGPQGVGPDILHCGIPNAVGDPTMQYRFVCLDLHLEDLKMTRCESKHVAHIVINIF